MAAYCPYCMSPTSPGQRCPNCGADPASYHPSSHHFPMGQRLHKRYLVGRVLGEGGFGITYLGLDTTLERRVAIKEYFPNVFVYRETSVSLDVTCYEGEKRTFYEKGRDQFLQEARVMARFDKAPEIVQVLDFFPANNTAYIVMELLEGDTLRTVLARQGRIPQKYLFEIMEPVLRTMNAMHGAGIIHRDISPDNIMLLKSGQVKLLDFGCARDVDREHTMTVMLKHGYAPMEQYTGYNQGPWTDIYALCATLYHCLTGQPPPRALDRMAGKDPLVPPNRLGAALTPERERALLRGLAVEPRDRWQSTAGLYAALYGTVIKDFPWLPGMQETEILSETETESVQVEAKPESERGTIPLFLDLESESEPQEEWKWEQKKIPEPKPKPESETKPEPEPKPEPRKEHTPRKSERKKALLVGTVACCLLVLAALCFFLVRRADSPEKNLAPRGTDKPAAVSDNPPSSSCLGETEDAGREYLDKMIFLGDSTTYSIGYYYEHGFADDLVPPGQIWTPASGTLTLSYYATATIVYPETGEELFIRDAVERAKPEYLVITLGVNGISFMDEAWFIRDYTYLVESVKAASPETKIILNSIYPVTADYPYQNDINNDKIRAANGWVEQVAENTGVRFLYSFEAVADADGNLPEDSANGDGLHLTGEAFVKVMRYIRTHAYQ